VLSFAGGGRFDGKNGKGGRSEAEKAVNFNQKLRSMAYESESVPARHYES